MKQIAFPILFLWSVVASGQVIVNGKDINKLPKVQYIELIEDARPFMQRQVFAVIDYGQPIRFLELRRHRIQDEYGQDKLFGSEMDIFNFLYQNGWIHETTFAGESHMYHIFRRKVGVPTEK